jgi:hypothetical protein
MKRLTIGIVAALCLAGCGGGGSDPVGKVCDGASTTPPALAADYAPNFVAQWVGFLTVQMNGQSSSDVAELTVKRSGVNLLSTDICPGMPALVTGSDTFVPVCFVCPPQKVSGVCDSMVISFADGTGTLSSLGSQLDVDLTGAVDGCGYHYDLTMTFANASRYAAAGVSDAGEPVGLGDAILQAAARTR